MEPHNISLWKGPSWSQHGASEVHRCRPHRSRRLLTAAQCSRECGARAPVAMRPGKGIGPVSSEEEENHCTCSHTGLQVSICFLFSCINIRIETAGSYGKHRWGRDRRALQRGWALRRFTSNGGDGRCPAAHPHLALSSFCPFVFAILIGIVSFICIFLLTGDWVPFLWAYFSFAYLAPWSVFSNRGPFFEMGLLVSLSLGWGHSLYILLRLLFQIRNSQAFPRSGQLAFWFSFLSLTWKFFAKPNVMTIFPMLYSKSLVFSCFIFRAVIYFELAFVKCTGYVLKLIFLHMNIQLWKDYFFFFFHWIAIVPRSKINWLPRWVHWWFL